MTEPTSDDITVGTGCDLDKGLVYLQFSQPIKTLVLNREDTVAFIKAIRNQLKKLRHKEKGNATNPD